MNENAYIVGEVTHRSGDGPLMTIRKGPVEIDHGPHDVTFHWDDGKARLSAVMPKTEFRRFMGTGAIKMVVGAH